MPGGPGVQGRPGPAGAEPGQELPQPEPPGDGPQPARPGEHEPPGEYAQPGAQRPGAGPAQQPPHQQAPPPPGTGGQQPAEEPEAPDQVHASRTLWLLTAVMVLLSQLSTLLPGAYRRPLEDYREILGSMAEQFTDEQLQQSVTLAQWLTVAMVAVVAAVVVLLAGQMRKGRNWARALLTAGGIVVVANGMSALLVLLSGGTGVPGTASVSQFGTLAGAMLAGLFCAVAIWQMYTEPAKKFFLERNGVPPQR